MRSTPHSFANVMAWDEWTVTASDNIRDRVEFGYPRLLTTQSKRLINVGYPGFTVALGLLESLGCNAYFVTSVLKFCILRANNEPLDTFLLASKTLVAVEHALALDLTWDEYVAALASTNVKNFTGKLPSNLAFGDNA